MPATTTAWNESLTANGCSADTHCGPVDSSSCRKASTEYDTGGSTSSLKRVATSSRSAGAGVSLIGTDWSRSQLATMAAAVAQQLSFLVWLNSSASGQKMSNAWVTPASPVIAPGVAGASMMAAAFSARPPMK